MKTPRTRPYNGQPHTDTGERGKTLVEGLTMRDIVDCYVMGLLESCEDRELSDKVKQGTWEWNDVYKIPVDFDPIAVSQNMTCHIEMMMGIFPNLPELKGHMTGESP